MQKYCPKENDSILKQAVLYASLDCIRELINHDFEIKFTHLVLVIKERRIGVLEYFIEQCSVNIPDNICDIACFYGSTNCLKYLVKKGYIVSINGVKYTEIKKLQSILEFLKTTNKVAI